MERADLISGVVLAVFGLMMLAFVIPMQIEQAPEGYVSPRLVPNLAMIVVVGLSALLIVKTLRQTQKPTSLPEIVFSRSEMMALLKISTVFAVALVLFWLGTPLGAGVVLVAGTLIFLGERRPLILTLMPAGLLLAIWVLFYKVLGTAIV
ncbi:tripartite tricarboxylate transporter TctB family protein [Thalassovita taeanensis]|uniref:Tripartite tricarboxylate transporter TctB family protein n=1 Tax=Thalassovita taeanensis TaxID=657014 RepID=A0A1H9LDI5_9RHOB|nr:tripartite tricarboxylate transporter TctB family protein [Thalassovita taeanensis]SER09561.1 Tripartite tricarboxylate transporter TctB family protein [Thalassovita taeanensis]